MIPALRTAVPGQRILAADFNANFDAVRTTLNTKGAFTDTARTFTVPQTFQGGAVFTGPADFTSATLIGLPNFARRDAANIFTGSARFNQGGSSLEIGAGTSDHAFLAIFARTASPNARSGYLGVPAAGANTVDLANEMGGNIRLIAGGNSTIIGGNGVAADRYNAADGSVLIRRVATYSIIHDSDGRQAILAGGAGDPKNYFDNATHVFRDRAGAVQATLGSSPTSVSLRFQRSPSGANGGWLYSDTDGFGLLHRDGTWALRTAPSGLLQMLQRADRHAWSDGAFSERMVLLPGQLDVYVPIGVPVWRLEDTRTETLPASPSLAGVSRPMFKQADALGLGDGFGNPLFYALVQSHVLWSDNSGGGVFDLAHADDGNVYLRYRLRGQAPGPWRRFVTELATFGAPPPPPSGQLATPTLSAEVVITDTDVVATFTVTAGGNWPGGVAVEADESLDGGAPQAFAASLTFQRTYVRGLASQTASVRARGLTSGALATSEWSNTAPVFIPAVGGGNPVNNQPGP